MIAEAQLAARRRLAKLPAAENAVFAAGEERDVVALHCDGVLRQGALNGDYLEGTLGEVGLGEKHASQAGIAQRLA